MAAAAGPGAARPLLARGRARRSFWLRGLGTPRKWVVLQGVCVTAGASRTSWMCSSVARVSLAAGLLILVPGQASLVLRPPRPSRSSALHAPPGEGIPEASGLCVKGRAAIM